MVDSSRTIALILGMLAVTTVGYADMIPVSSMGSGHAALPTVLPTNSSSLFDSPGMVNVDVGSLKFLPEANTDAGQTVETQRPQITTNGPNSLALCLSALMGLGLCSSVHWVKRLSFGSVPEWYHNGGPFQIGHSHAIHPRILCSVPVYCFVQPARTTDDTPAQCHRGTIVSLWRKSQCITRTLGSRAPPEAS